MTVCKGCGAVLQTTDSKLIGYSPKAEAEYCQRCFRLIHYDDLTISMKTGIDPVAVVNRIARMDALILWVIDLYDFEAGIINGINRKFANKDIVMVATKRDLLPASCGEEKIAHFVFGRLKDLGICIERLILASKEEKMGVEEIKECVDELANGRKIVVIGKANSGKSTLINNLMSTQVLTTSRYPGTTLEFNELEIDGHTYIDTPGIEIDHSMLMEVNEADLKTIMPSKSVKPQVFQLRGEQSFFVGGLARLDLSGCNHASCVWYLSDRLNVHRTNGNYADEKWNTHVGTLFVPTAIETEMKKYTIHKDMPKVDIVIDGLGWACVSGEVSTITVHVPKSVSVTFRKAML